MHISTSDTGWMITKTGAGYAGSFLARLPPIKCTSQGVDGYVILNVFSSNIRVNQAVINWPRPCSHWGACYTGNILS